jgi:hypothetical protein
MGPLSPTLTASRPMAWVPRYPRELTGSVLSASYIGRMSSVSFRNRSRVCEVAHSSKKKLQPSSPGSAGSLNVLDGHFALGSIAGIGGWGSPDRGTTGRRRSRPHSRPAVRRLTDAASRPGDGDRSCRCARRQAYWHPSRSARPHHPARVALGGRRPGDHRLCRLGEPDGAPAITRRLSSTNWAIWSDAPCGPETCTAPRAGARCWSRWSPATGRFTVAREDQGDHPALTTTGNPGNVGLGLCLAWTSCRCVSWLISSKQQAWWAKTLGGSQ